jgi:zinc protease
MIRAALLLLLGALAACGGGGSGLVRHPDELVYPPLKFDPPDVASMRAELAGGVPAYLVEDASLPIVDLRILIRGGQFDEPKGREGLAGLTAGLMRMGGTSTRTPEAVDEELDFLAANLSVTVEDVQGAASLSVLSKDLDRGLEILWDVLKNPAFKAEKLATLKAQTLDGLKARNDSTAAIEAREANRLFYGDYPLNRLATRASVEATSREDLQGFHRWWVHPRNFLVAAAGAFKKDELRKKLEAAFASWPAAPEPAAPRVVPPPVAHRPQPGITAFHKGGKNINQGRVTFGHMGIDVKHPDVQALRVMSYILGAGGFSSRLMQKVRTEEGLAYDVHSDLRPGIVYPFPFKIVFQSKSESVAYAGKLCLDEIEKIRRDGVTAEELKAAQAFFIDAFPGLFFATRFQTAATYAQAELTGLPKDYYRTYRERIAALTTEEIRRVAREHLRPERFAWVVVGDLAAIRPGDGKHPVKLEDLGPVTELPLADPYTLERPR